MNKQYALMVVLTLNLYGFNPGYHGNDAHISFETMWEKERFVKADYIRYFPYYTRYVEQFSKIDITKLDLKRLPAPYNQLANLYQYNSWGYYVNSEYIAKLFARNTIKTALEVGSDLGASTRHIASLLPQDGTLHAVDVWDNSTNEGYRDGRYEQFLSNTVHAGLYNIIIPVKQRSEIALPQMHERGMKFDFIYIDGDHATLAVFADLENAYPLLAQHGMMAGDDWMLKSVRAGVLLFAQLHNLTVYGIGNFWMVKDEGVFGFKELDQASDDIWNF